MDFTAESIGIVAPVYGHEVPPMVKKFMEKAAFHTDYFYMVLTYGNRHGGAAELAERFCRACGILPNYINVLLMVDNWLPGFDVDEQKAKDRKVDECLEKIVADIHSRKNMIAEVTDDDRTVHRQFLDNIRNLPDDAWKHLIQVRTYCFG